MGRAVGATAWGEAGPGAQPAPHRRRPPAGTCLGRLPDLSLNNRTTPFSFGDSRGGGHEATTQDMAQPCSPGDEGVLGPHRAPRAGGQN